MNRRHLSSCSSRILSDVVCSVCRDNSSGKHYGIYSCDGCAGFFKRSIRRSRQYLCKSRYNNNCGGGGCPVDKTHRNQCRACRLVKCIQAGMNKDSKWKTLMSCWENVCNIQLGGRHIIAVNKRTAVNKLQSKNLEVRPDCLLHSNKFFPFVLVDVAAVQHERGPRCSTIRRQVAGVYDRKSPERNDDAEDSDTDGRVDGERRDDTKYGNDEKEQQDKASHEFSPLVGRESANNSSLLVTCSPRFNTTATLQSNASLQLHGFNGTAPILTALYYQHSQCTRDMMLSYHEHQQLLQRRASINAEALSEAAAQLLFMTIKWAKNIPSFVSLPPCDQAALLEEGWTELFVLGAAQFNVPFDVDTILNATDISKIMTSANNNITAVTSRAVMIAEIRILQDIIAKFQAMQVDQPEYACLKGIVLFKTALQHKSNGKDKMLQDTEAVALLQDQAQVALSLHVRTRYNTEPTRFGKLLLALPVLKAVSPHVIVELFFKKAIGNIPLEKLLVDMYNSGDI